MSCNDCKSESNKLLRGGGEVVQKLQLSRMWPALQLVETSLKEAGEERNYKMRGMFLTRNCNLDSVPCFRTPKQSKLPLQSKCSAECCGKCFPCQESLQKLIAGLNIWSGVASAFDFICQWKNAWPGCIAGI